MKTIFKIFSLILSYLMIVDAAIAQSSADDFSLASSFAPIIHLSQPNPDGEPIDLQDGNYPYSDFYPVRVEDLISSPSAAIVLRLGAPLTIGEDTFPPADVVLDNPIYFNFLGMPGIRSAANSLLFSTSSHPNQIDEMLALKELAGDPAVYFRVFRDTNPQNLRPIAVQYWFFYFYNKGVLNHPGDWESVTVFLDANAEPREVIYSARNEANKYSWINEIFEETRSGDHFPVYVSNGSHGSYAFPGETNYSFARDIHHGDGGTFDFQNGDYTLIDLGELENNPNSWVWFEGRWGNDGVDISSTADPAPKGPMLRQDAATGSEWFNASNRPFDPFDNCLNRRNGANIYDPWYWASGYGLDTSWTSTDDCLDATLNLLTPTGINTQALGNQLFASWDPVTNASGYKILLGLNSGEYTLEFGTTGATTFNTFLEDGTYYLAIVAFNLFVESELSQEVMITVGENSAPLHPPAILEVLVQDGVVSVTWGTLLGASGYTLQYGLIPGEYLGSVDMGTLTNLSGELPPGSYYLRIAGYDGNKEPGIYTDEIVLNVSPPIDVPTLVSPGGTSPPVPTLSGLAAALKWNAVQEATFYNLIVRDITDNRSIVNVNGLDSTGFAIPVLKPGHSYRWSVQACNSSTCSDFSERFYFDTN